MPSALLAQLTAAAPALAVLVRLGSVRLASTAGSVTVPVYDSEGALVGTHTWTGGLLHGVGALEESMLPVPTHLDVRLSAADPAVSRLWATNRQGDPAELHLTAFDDDGDSVGSVELWDGQVLGTHEEGAVQVVHCESALAGLAQVPGWRFNHDSQRQRHPTDRFFQFVDAMVHVRLQVGDEALFLPTFGRIGPRGGLPGLGGGIQG